MTGSVNEIAGMRVAIYARHSTDSQDRSVPAQLDRCREMAHRNGARVVEEFADEGVSGAVMHERPGIMALIHAAADGEYQAVLIEDLSRISRDQADIATIFKVLEFHGASMVSATEGKISQLHIGLKGTMNALFLRDLSDKVRRGQFAAFASGRVPGGRLYGYDLVKAFSPNGKPVTGQRRINEAEAAIVRRIFEQAAAGRPYRDITKDLNDAGIPSPTGGTWAASTLVGTRRTGKGLLRNPIYRGQIVFGRTRVTRHPTTGKKIAREVPESEWKVCEAPELAIVTEELFRATQKAIDRRTRGRRALPPRRPARGIRYVTSGKTWCRDCGGRVTTAHSSYLVCRTWHEHGTCQQRHHFKRHDVIDEVARILAGRRGKAAVFRAIAEEAATRRKHTGWIQEDFEDIEQAIARVAFASAAIRRKAGKHPAYSNAIEDIAIPAADIDAIRRRIRNADATLAILSPEESVRALAAAASAKLALAARRYAAKATRTLADQQLLQAVVERITVAYQVPGRTDLRVTVKLNPMSCYDLGLESIQGDQGRKATAHCHGLIPRVARATPAEFQGDHASRNLRRVSRPQTDL